MNEAVTEFTEQELDIVRAILAERYSHVVVVELADSEMLLDSNTDIFTTCPTAYWSHVP